MEIVLLEKIKNVGELGDVVTVKNGYARNFLIPQKKAVLATEDAKTKVEEKRRKLAEEEGQRLEGAKARAELASKAITLSRLCAAEGQLYGSVTPADIATALSTAEMTFDKSEIVQPDGLIKQIGEHEAEVVLHPDVRFTVKIIVNEDSGDDTAPTD